MQRVMVIGGPGAGKSTLAREIGARLGLPVVHIDALFWQPGWVEGDRAALASRLREIYADTAWVVEGNYSATWPERLARADTLIHLDLPGWLRLLRVLRRALRHRGRVRPDMAPGCPERLDLEFLPYVLGYRAKRRPAALRLAETAPDRVTCHRLASPAEVRAFLSRLPERTA